MSLLNNFGYCWDDVTDKRMTHNALNTYEAYSPLNLTVKASSSEPQTFIQVLGDESMIHFIVMCLIVTSHFGSEPNME